MFEVRPYEAGDRDAWNALNRASRCGHFLFDRDFLEYHSDRFVDASQVIVKDGRICALFPANRVDDVVHSHQGLSFGGLIHNARQADVLSILDTVCATFKDQGASRLVYKPMPSLYHGRPAGEDLYWLFLAGALLVRRDASATIAYAKPGEVSSRRMRGASKAAKAGLTFGETSERGGFWGVLTETLESRHGVKPVHSLAEIDKLAASFPQNIRLFVAQSDGVVLAGVLMFNNWPCAHAQYIAANPTGRDVGALDGLFTYVIGLCREEGFVTFDFGISTEDQGRILNRGLMTQKEEFGASVTCFDVYDLLL